MKKKQNSRKKKIEEIRINNIIEKAVKNISIKMEFEHKRKIDKIISSHNQEIKRINESLNGQVLNEIYNENKILKSETEENNRLIEKLITSNKLLNIDKTKSENEKQQLEEKIKSLELKLQNCQKVLKNTPNFKNKIIESENDLEGKTLKSNDFDGSKGWHELARENGKFGSLPSFDNYSDEYLDDSKNGFE
ncbi:MAG: hypothetical protein IPH28_21715 [Cytophagaceae bacterium]|nr:hypothetical protein [Cytophagaceae bacterium]